MPAQTFSLEVDQSPPRLGGYLSGVIQAPLTFHGAEVYLEVVAVQTRWTTSQGNEPEQVTTLNLWRRIVVLDGAVLERGPERVAIPFSVRLPAGGKATTVRAEDKRFSQARTDVKKKLATGPFGLGNVVEGDASEAVDLGSRPVALSIGGVTFGGVKKIINWRVRLGVVPPDGKITGASHLYSFEVPVARGQGAEPAGAPPRSMPEFVAENFAGHSEPKIERLADGAVFHFSAPFPGALFFGPLLFAGGLTAFAGNPMIKGTDAVKWGWIILGGIAALFLAHWMLEVKRSRVGQSGIRIERVWWFPRTIPHEEIVDVADVASLSDPVTFAVAIHTRNGASYEVIPGVVTDVREAKWLARELKRMICASG